jgi:N-acetylneuraminic acid mutarotase
MQATRWHTRGAGVAVGLAVVSALTATAFTGPASADSGSWSTQAPSGLKRQEVSYVQVGGKLYLAGGKSTVQQVYDPATNTWSTVAPLPFPPSLDHIQTAAVDGKIYYIGGITSWPNTSVGDVYVYDPATDTVTSGAPMPAGRDRGAGGVAAYNGKIYIAGGVHDGTTVAWFDVYDPATDTWASLPDLPHRRDHFQAAIVNDRFWAIGGRVSSSATRVGYNEAFDFATGKWLTGFAPLPTLRGGFATAVFGTEVVVIGGEGGGATFNTVEAYNTASNTWRTLTPMPTARHGIQAAMWNGSAYIADGGLKQGGGAPTDVHERLTVSPMYRPDAQIRLSSETAFAGNNIYNTTGAGQTKSATSAPGQTISFVVRAQNDGTATDGFTFHGCAATSGFTVRYFVGATGTTEITSAVLAGTYRVTGVAPGGTRAVRLEVATGGSTPSGAMQSCLVSITSTSATALVDAVLGTVTVA